MWLAITGAVAKIGGFIADLASAALKWMGVIFAYKLGKKNERAKQTEKTSEIQQEQLDVASRRPRDRSDIIDRMRDNDL